MLINATYRRMFAGGLFSVTGDQLNSNALRIWIGGVLLAGMTQAPMIIGLISILSVVVSILVAPVAGVLAERWNKWRTMMAVDAAMACLMGATAFILWQWAETTPLWLLVSLICVVTMMTAGAGQFLMPSRIVTVRNTVPDDKLGRATGYLHTQGNIAQMVGPSLAAGVMAVAGIAAAFLINAMSFVFSFVMLKAARKASQWQEDPPTGDSAKPSFGVEFREGWQGVTRDRFVRGIFVAGIIGTAAMTMVGTLQIFFVMENLDSSAYWYGIMVAIFGGGSIAGSLLGSRLADTKWAPDLLYLSLIAGGVLLLALSRMTDLTLALTINGLFGFVMGIFNVIAFPMMVRLVPSEKLGRVSSLFSLTVRIAGLLSIAVSTTLAGTILAGLDATVWGMNLQRIDVIFMVAGVGLAISGGWCRRKLGDVGSEIARRQSELEAASAAE